jgi:hypothetical protein
MGDLTFAFGKYFHDFSIFIKIQNDPNRVFRAVGETDM